MSSFGNLFRVTTFGESHCKGVGCIVEGVPPRMQLTSEHIQQQLNRRRPGQSNLTTPRNEADAVTILSGTEFNSTLGTPIALLVNNLDQRPNDYSDMTDMPRPSHADYTYQVKYGVRASSGGGRASARETIGRVAAGAIADKWLTDNYSTSIVAWVSQVGHVKASREWEVKDVTRQQVDANFVRCPDQAAAEQMAALIAERRDEKDSVGGVVTCVVTNPPAGLGEPVFDKLEAMLAHAMLSIPATKGFEIGSGFEGCAMKGSQHNDMFTLKHNKAVAADQQTQTVNGTSGDRLTPELRTVTNRSGGIQGGISNGEPIVFRVAFKPPATIGQVQHSVTFDGVAGVLEAKGRHDPCVVPRAVPIVEAMTALVLADAALIQEARTAASKQFQVMGRVGPQQKQKPPATCAAQS